ncbi:MAG: hypothetical protein MI723_08265 [Caulobacterales bacterium]|nr:hypothetical protein [Caulobacterales bacterium]
MRFLALSIASACAVGACAGEDEPATAADGLTPEQAAAYERCLADSQAVAMAWEAIEQRCRDQALGRESETPLQP